MREILFRGKRKNWDNPWVEGYLARKDLIFSWSETSMEEIFGGEKLESGTYFYNDYPVKPETVGQYTGIKDKNGTKIFEGDIVKKNVNGRELKGLVKYKDCAFGVMINDDGNGLFLCFFNDCEVIGNIYDNPELLEVDNENTKHTI